MTYSKKLTPTRIAEMEEAFDAIKDKDDWKAPISALIPMSEFELYADAVMFFTGTRIRVRGHNPEGQGVLFISSKGYRNGPAGDH
jgi:hypothetical protein